MKLSDFDYHLPPDLIAFYPAEKRDESRMLVLERAGGSCEIRRFADLPEFLSKGDCVVINNSKVFKSRLFVSPTDSPEKKAEIFLFEPLDGQKRRWKVLAKPKRLLKKHNLFFAIGEDGKISDDLQIKIIERVPEIIVELFSSEDVQSAIEKFAHVPLPPYIKRKDEQIDISRYQTIYAKETGSVAAPTAGLHFTEEVFAKFAEKGIKVAELTLHVGIGTFRPVRTENISEHKMHSEYFSISEECAENINRTRAEGGKILAVGTTSLRCLESALTEDGRITAKNAYTDIFIYPPYKVKSADMLLTNFHLPKSTLLMLVSAFAGYENIMNAYQLAIEKKLRFYSYGDCMLIK